jgi:hypothetical protein
MYGISRIEKMLKINLLILTFIVWKRDITHEKYQNSLLQT